MLITIKQYLFFRCKQFFRILKEIGIGHLIILFPILIVATLGVLQFILTSQVPTVAALILFIIIGNHWVRKDRFLLEQLSSPLMLFFLLDYFLLCSPFIGCFIFWSKWSNLLVLSSGLFIISIIKPPYPKEAQKKIMDAFSLNWIPIELFEWRCGLRKNPFSFFAIYLVGFILCYYPVTIPICLFLMALTVTTFFQFFENKDLLLATNKDKKLLLKKTIGSLKLFNLLTFPYYVLFLILHHQGFQYIAALFIVGIISQLILVFSIAMKYKTYTFHDHKIYNSLPLGIFVGCLAIPFLWPIPIMMIIRFWKKAQENLTYHYA